MPYVIYDDATRAWRGSYATQALADAAVGSGQSAYSGEITGAAYPLDIGPSHYVTTAGAITRTPQHTTLQARKFRYAAARPVWLHIERVFASDRAWGMTHLYFERTTAGIPDLYNDFRRVPPGQFVHEVRSRSTWHWAYAGLVEYVMNGTAAGNYDTMLNLEGLGIEGLPLWYANHSVGSAITNTAINDALSSGILDDTQLTAIAAAAPWWAAIKTRLPYLTAGLQGGSGFGITATGSALPAAPVLTGTGRNVLTFYDAEYPLAA